MGQSTDALMAFGFDLGEELPDSFTAGAEDGFEADEFLLRDYDAGIPEWTPGVGSDYWGKKDEALAKLPVDVITHCSGEYPMYFLAVRGTSRRATRGTPVVADQYQIGVDQIAALRTFCEKHGIEWREPRWHIFSMWN
jgi:hypothetical protein